MLSTLDEDDVARAATALIRAVLDDDQDGQDAILNTAPLRDVATCLAGMFVGALQNFCELAGFEPGDADDAIRARTVELLTTLPQVLENG